MSRFQKISILGFLLMLAALVYLEASKKPPISWFPSYSSYDKIPYGTYVLDDLLNAEFGERFSKKSIPPFEALNDPEMAGTYLFINRTIGFDKTEMEKLLAWMEQGNTVFVATNYPGFTLMDTLGLEAETYVRYDDISTEPVFSLVNRALNPDRQFHLERNVPLRHFTKIDTLHHKVLGHVRAHEDITTIEKPLINFINIPVGEGNLYLHLQPEVATNFFMLTEDNATYTRHMLSYIPEDSPIYWDSYYKAGKKVNTSPLYLLLNNKYLKWAYYFVLICVVLFVLFEGKRKQRSIPIVPPLTNRTYEYTRTISGMYLDQKQSHEIAQKQIALFFEYVRSQLRQPTEHMNSRFFQAVAARSGNTLEDTKSLFTFIEKVQHQQHTSSDELIKLYKDISAFKHKIDGKS